MKSICKKTRVTDPAGVWDYYNLIGATVRICSVPVSNLNNIFSFDNTTLQTIEDVYFRVSTDGKIICVVRLVGMPDYLFTLKDLEILNLRLIKKAVCGLCLCNQTICGKE